MLPSVTFLFIRHGQQEAQKGVIGRLSPLSHKGRLQAEALAAELAGGPPVAAVYSSPLSRATATAEAIGSRLSLIPVLEPRLAEFELGTRPIQEITDRSDLLVWRPDDMGEDGVTLYAFGQRIGMFCDEIAARYTGERVAVVSHAGTIDAAVRWALGIGADSPWQHELEVQHASITEVEFWPRGRIIGGSPRYAVLRRLGYTAHLGEFVSDL
jgi:ribonuclease H / adenosylcobalamin/alpha-ribazole phosphatase